MPDAKIGHNRANTVAGERLKSLIERIEKLEEERADLGADIREVFSEAKGAGFDTKIMRQVIRLRKMEPAERAEMDELRDIYKQAIGMLDGTPLGDAARQRFEEDTVARAAAVKGKGKGKK